MSEAKFTPGPWKLESDNYTGSNDESFLEWVEAGPARVYLSRHNPTERAEQVANANLIAAAPELYAALKAALIHPCVCRNSLKDCHAKDCSVLQTRAALGKADGQ